MASIMAQSKLELIKRWRVQRFNVEMTAFNIELTSSSFAPMHLLEFPPFTLAMDLESPLPSLPVAYLPLPTSVPSSALRRGSWLHVKLAPICMSLSQLQYGFVMGLLSGNLAETSAVVQSLLDTGVWQEVATHTSAAVLAVANAEEPSTKAAPTGPMSPTSQTAKLSTQAVIPVEPPVPFHLTVELESISAELKRGDGMRGAADSLLTFRINQIFFKMVQCGIDLEGYLTLGTVELVDSSLETVAHGVQPAFRQIVSIVSHSFDAQNRPVPPLIVTVTRNDGGMVVDVEMANLRFSFAGVLYSLGTFFTVDSPDARPEPPVLKRQASSPPLESREPSSFTSVRPQQLSTPTSSRRQSSKAEIGSPVPRGASAQKVAPFEFRFVLKQGSFQLVDQPTLPVSRSLLLVWQARTMVLIKSNGITYVSSQMHRIQVPDTIPTKMV